MTDEARLVIEAMKQAFDIFDKMELPIEERKCTLEYDSVIAIIKAFEQVTRERDAAVKDLREVFYDPCEMCAHADVAVCDEPCLSCELHIECGDWQWRGVEVKG